MNNVVLDKQSMFEACSEPTIEAPEPLPEERMQVLAFDINMMPEALQPYIDDVSKRMQCPPDFIAVGVLCSLASLVGNQAVTNFRYHLFHLSPLDQC